MNPQLILALLYFLKMMPNKLLHTVKIMGTRIWSCGDVANVIVPHIPHIVIIIIYFIINNKIYQSHAFICTLMWKLIMNT